MVVVKSCNIEIVPDQIYQKFCETV